MAFVNERISEEDKLRFNLGSIMRPPNYSDPIRLVDWTVDKDRKIFLVWTKGSSEDERNSVYFALGWGGEIIHLKLLKNSVGQIKEHVDTTWNIEHAWIPPALQASRKEIISALKEALITYKVQGVLVPVASHEAKFEF